MKSYYYCDSPIGKLTLVSEDEHLIGLYFGEVEVDGINESSIVISDALVQLEEYFKRSRREFTIPLKFYGTKFQKKCWEELLKIPYGETKSYKEIANLVGSPKGYRAVGMANNKNPISIIAPCHRVIGSNGKLVGFGGGIDKKEFLIYLEKSNK